MKKNRENYLIIAFVLIGLVIILFLNNEGAEKVCIKSKCFDVEIADSVEERQRGLMFREKIEDNEGMLFIFEKSGIYPFWMKNTLIPLDIIWINSNKEIVFIHENMQPCKKDACESYNPDVEALYVLEINRGLVSDMGFHVGDKVDFIIEVLLN